MTTYSISREWLNRMGLILFFLIGSAAWFFYDGLVAYPASNEIFNARQAAIEKFGENSRALEIEWQKIAAENAFPQNPDDLPDHFKNPSEQIHWGIGLLAIAALLGIHVLRSSLRKIRADETEFDGITCVPALFAGTKKVRFDSIVGIDKTRWEKKGIAKIFYRSDADSPRESVLVDDYKYAHSEAILTRCESVFTAKKTAAEAEKSVPAKTENSVPSETVPAETENSR